MQGDVATTRAFLAEIAAVERGEAPQPGGAGNAFSITVEPGGAIIDSAVVEDAAPEHYSLAELLTALAAWAAAIARALRGGG